MTRPLSNDLRRRAVTAVVDGGGSRRGAARRFGIAPSTRAISDRGQQNGSGQAQQRVLQQHASAQTASSLRPQPVHARGAADTSPRFSRDRAGAPHRWRPNNILYVRVRKLRASAFANSVEFASSRCCVCRLRERAADERRR